jgi:hypothetical protein
MHAEHRDQRRRLREVVKHLEANANFHGKSDHDRCSEKAARPERSGAGADEATREACGRRRRSDRAKVTV